MEYPQKSRIGPIIYFRNIVGLWDVALCDKVKVLVGYVKATGVRTKATVV